MQAKKACFSITVLVFAMCSIAQQVSKWGIFEAAFTASGSYSNPYLNASMKAVFTGPSGQKINIDGFWDGSKTWKIRMTPTETGTWSYTTSSADAGLNNKSGSFECIASSSKGHIRVSKAFPFTFEYSDGSPFFWLGETNWDWNHLSTPFDGTFQHWIDTRVSQGFTLIQGTLHPSLRDVYGYRHCGKNEGGFTYTTGVSAEDLNPAYFQWMDKRVDYIEKKGMPLAVWFAWARDWNNGVSGDRYTRYAEYVIARYSCYNIIWGVLGEYEEMNNPSAVRDAGTYIKSIDPYKHPLSSHTVATTADDFGSDTWIDFHGQQYWEQGLISNGYIIRDRKWGKPVVNMEFGYEREPVGTKWDGTPESVRKALWCIFAGGGFGTYGELTIAWDKEAAPVDWNTALFLPAASQVKHLNNFSEMTQWWDMAPENGLVSTGYCLRKPNSEYVIYLLSGSNVSVNLSAAGGSFSVEWYNPRTGAMQKASDVNGGGSRSFTAPDNNDWVLHIGKYTPVSIQPVYHDRRPESAIPSIGRLMGNRDCVLFDIMGRSLKSIATTERRSMHGALPPQGVYLVKMGKMFVTE